MTCTCPLSTGLSHLTCLPRVTHDVRTFGSHVACRVSGALGPLLRITWSYSDVFWDVSRITWSYVDVFWDVSTAFESYL